MNDDKRTYWFPAKRYGWGWGPPCAWQGWVVLAVYLLLLSGGALVLPPAPNPEPFLAYVFALSVLLTLVAWKTGEKPRWRWGGK